MEPLTLTFHAVSEPQPGERWQRRFEELWPGYRAWFLRDGDAARPSYAVARAMLATHMPELVPTWERLVDLAGGGDLAARMLSLYGSPPLVSGCSQAVFTSPEPVLVRNYDFDPALLEGVIVASALTGRRVLGMSDCLWGLLDGINDAGLAISLAFGGRRATREGFAIPLVVRYLLELCETTAGAVEVLRRLPVQAAYNLTILDRSGVARDRVHRRRPAADRRRRADRDQPPVRRRVGGARARHRQRGARAADARAARRPRGRRGRVHRRVPGAAAALGHLRRRLRDALHRRAPAGGARDRVPLAGRDLASVAATRSRRAASRSASPG